MEGKAARRSPPSEPGPSAVGVVEGTRWLGGLCHCDPLQVAILVPFRNRHEHLPVLLRHLIPMLQRQRLQFAFYVVEQVSGPFFSLLSLPRLQLRELQADPSLGLRAHEMENSRLSGSVGAGSRGRPALLRRDVQYQQVCVLPGTSLPLNRGLLWAAFPGTALGIVFTFETQEIRGCR